jgi:Major fimbrial subunit protein (FimA)
MMKLKNIIYAGLALLVCAGCSKDEEGQKPGDDKANLSVKLFATGATTKAYMPDSNNELPGEGNVNNLSVLVFNENGSGMLASPYWGKPELKDGVFSLTNIEVSPAKAQIVFVANTEQGTFDGVNTYADFKNKMAQLAEQRQDFLTMSSQVIVTQKALETGDNYLGYSSFGSNNINGLSSPIEVTRLAARLDLANVRTNFSRPELLGRSVAVESIYVANQKTASSFFSTNYWGTVMVDGNLAKSEEVALSILATPTTLLTETPSQFVVKATLAASAKYEAETRYFTATINENGLQKGYNHNYVKRNYVYRITITFRDGNFDGDHEEPVEPPVPPIDPPVTAETQLDVQVQVAGWGPINQIVEI